MKNILNKLNDSFLNENKYVFKKYKTIKKIGTGSFSNIYSTIRISDKNVFAMKTEKRNAKESILESEAYYLFTLKGFGIPNLISFGHTKKYNILIETLLDKSLYNIFFQPKKICSEIDASLIALQILDRLEWIHSKNIIYRDVKPENFMIGIEDPNIIYIIDFGICKKYRSSKTGKHILPRYTGKFNGTLIYASVNAIRGKELSRRDDLISLGYMLIYLLKKQLPWTSSFQKLDKKSYFQLLYLKETNGRGEIFHNVPGEYVEYFRYVQNLKFEQEPNYSYLRSIFIQIISKKKLNYKELSFSWISPNKKKLLGIPKHNSARRSGPCVRILKSLREERIKRQNSETFNRLIIKNNPLDFSISNNHNKQVSLNGQSENKLSLNNYNLDHKIRLNCTESFLNLNNKEPNTTKKNYKQTVKNIKGTIYNKKKKPIQKKLKPKLVNIQSFNNSNLNLKSHIPYTTDFINNKEHKINFLYTNNIVPFKMKRQQNLSNNIKYQSPFNKNKKYLINLTNNEDFNKKIDINNNKKFQLNKNNDNLYQNNYEKDLNIILISNNIKLIQKGNNVIKENNNQNIRGFKGHFKYNSLSYNYY